MSGRSLALPLAAVAAFFAGPAAACFVHAPQPVQVWLDHVRIDVVNGVATKSYECAFKNPNGGEIVGGECYMELEPGAQIDGLSVTVDGKEHHGKTLFVSLALLKHLHATEANAVLAHEMAHFSGQDPLYSKKISPLLLRYGNCLQSLYDNVITRPVFYFMLCFRALFEL